MHVKLKVLRGASAGKEVMIRGPRFFIGRSEECHLRANSDAISRRHCAITVADQAVNIRDLGSRNGTYVNGVRIDGEHRIKVGDQLRVGPLEFLVTYLKSAAAKKPAPAVKSTSGDDDMAGLIDDWLSETDEVQPAEKSAAGETREFRLDETSRIELESGTPQGDPVEVSVDPPSAEVDAETTAETEANTPSPRVGPTPKRSNRTPPKDTQEAAAQTLRKFFNRGGNS